MSGSYKKQYEHDITTLAELYRLSADICDRIAALPDGHYHESHYGTGGEFIAAGPSREMLYLTNLLTINEAKIKDCKFEFHRNSCT